MSEKLLKSGLKKQDLQHLTKAEKKVLEDSTTEEIEELNVDDNLKWNEAYISWYDFLEGEGQKFSYEEIYDAISMGKLLISTYAVPPNPDMPSGIYALENYGPNNLLDFFNDYNVYIERKTIREIKENDSNEEEFSFNKFVRVGEYFKIVYDEHELLLKRSKGLEYIAYLIKNKGHHFTPSEIYNVFNPHNPSTQNKLPYTSTAKQKFQQLKDLEEENIYVHSGRYYTSSSSQKRTTENYALRLEEIEQELSEYGLYYTTEKIDKLHEEKEWIISELRHHKFSTFYNDPCRDKVGKAIQSAFKKIKANNSIVANHFKQFISTPRGNKITYNPGPNIDWITD